MRKNHLPFHTYVTFLCFFPFSLFLISVKCIGSDTLRPHQDRAIFFAVDNYHNPKWNDLKNPIKNARSIASVLSSKYGFDTTIIENPSLKTIASTIAALKEKYAKNQNGQYPRKGQLLLYFSGHGMLVDGNGYFMPNDGDPDSPITSGLPYTTWRRAISSIKCNHIFVAIDACYSSSFDPKYETRADPIFRRLGELSDEEKMLVDHDTSMTRIFFTSDAKEKETPDKSDFAQKFLQGLNYNNRNIFTSSQLYADYIDYASPNAKAGEFEDDKGGGFLFFNKNRKLEPLNLDIDKDGIMNQQDECPELYGKTASGCPDSDEDGIHDLKDPCPEKGPIYLNGCPDSDQDSIADKYDKCPDIYGIVINQGCPAPKGMVWVKGGSFGMGDLVRDNEEPDEQLHTVIVKDFFLARYELSFEEYEAYCKDSGSSIKPQIPDDMGWGGGKRPIINVNWEDAIKYCNWRSEKEGLTPVYALKTGVKGNRDVLNYKIEEKADGYRLPTEAEWEYAARERGKSVRFGNGKNFADPKEINFNSSKEGQKAYSVVAQPANQTHPVGHFNPNALGLYDMSGNVQEWCQSLYIRNPGNKNPIPTNLFVIRGGAWNQPPAQIRNSYRNRAEKYMKDYATGFRLARSIIMN